jgi:signal peptidase I
MQPRRMVDVQSAMTTRVWRAFRTIVLETLLPAWIIITFIAMPVTVDGDSMLPGIETGDVMVVLKLERWLDAWGLRPNYINRGDVIVLKPDDWRSSANLPFIGDFFGWKFQPYFVKRAIALEKDTFEIDRGDVILNETKLSEPYINGPATVENEAPLEVPARSVYVLGDNRLIGESIDSKRFGPQPFSRVAGRVVLRLWPLSKFGPVK